MEQEQEKDFCGCFSNTSNISVNCAAGAFNLRWSAVGIKAFLRLKHYGY